MALFQLTLIIGPRLMESQSPKHGPITTTANHAHTHKDFDSEVAYATSTHIPVAKTSPMAPLNFKEEDSAIPPSALKEENQKYWRIALMTTMKVEGGEWTSDFNNIQSHLSFLKGLCMFPWSLRGYRLLKDKILSYLHWSPST